jgi:hypothetical protein
MCGKPEPSIAMGLVNEAQVTDSFTRRPGALYSYELVRINLFLSYRYSIPKANRMDMRIRTASHNLQSGPGSIPLDLQCGIDDLLGFFKDRLQMRLILEALGIYLVDVLGA